MISGGVGETFVMPVGRSSLQTDLVVLADSGVYYAYSTGGPRGIVQVARSIDLRHWTWSGAALAAVPQWATGRAVWAPSLLRIGDRYVMHYAARDRATGQWCLSVAVAPRPNAVFVDTSTAPFLCQTDRGGSIELTNYPGRKVHRGLDVEKGGETPDGKAFKDIDDYKKLLLENKDQLARSMTQKLLVYSTGADIQFADREVVEQIVTNIRAKNYGFRTLIHEIVQSRVFLNK